MSRGGTRVYFGRLPRDTRERDLERFVRGFGRVREVSIKLGYGFVVSKRRKLIAKLPDCSLLTNFVILRSLPLLRNLKIQETLMTVFMT